MLHQFVSSTRPCFKLVDNGRQCEKKCTEIEKKDTQSRYQWKQKRAEHCEVLTKRSLGSTMVRWSFTVSRFRWHQINVCPFPLPAGKDANSNLTPHKTPRVQEESSHPCLALYYPPIVSKDTIARRRWVAVVNGFVVALLAFPYLGCSNQLKGKTKTLVRTVNYGRFGRFYDKTSIYDQWTRATILIRPMDHRPVTGESVQICVCVRGVRVPVPNLTQREGPTPPDKLS